MELVGPGVIFFNWSLPCFLTLIDQWIPTNATDDAGVNDLGYNAQYVFVVDTTYCRKNPTPNPGIHPQQGRVAPEGQDARAGRAGGRVGAA